MVVLSLNYSFFRFRMYCGINHSYYRFLQFVCQFCRLQKEMLLTGAPNDGFLLNTLTTLFRLSRVLFRHLEMHSKRRVICHPWGTCVFSKLQRLEYYFSEILDEIWRITKVRSFLIPLATTFLKPKKCEK